MTASSIVIHGHFYQPPREDPWFGEVEAEPTAAPYHDWNERIDHECYRPVTAARIPGSSGRIARIVNTLESISFNFGPTLLTWMERESPGSYAALLEADRASYKRLGFGNAIAMPYHHVILPLCSRRDKATEVRWGIMDFRRRFNREPDGMWLPEAAVDVETLEVLAEAGIRFTIVGPSQVRAAPAGGMPGRHRISRERSIAVFVYDGPLSHDVAFGPVIRDAGLWRDRMLLEGKTKQLVSLATDGETFGHHHKFAEMALAALLDQLQTRVDVRVENFSSFLARNSPTEDVVVVSPSSWSCVHGIERWRSGCSCKTAPSVPTQQAWRASLRAALDWLAAQLHDVFTREGAALLGDPWAARDEYGPVAARDAGALPVRARELLEMARNTLAMFTSCGWFFDDVGGIETVVVLRHAARAIELAGRGGERLEAGLLDLLAPALSNDPSVGDAARLYLARVKHRLPAPVRAGAGFAAARMVVPGDEAQLAGYELSGGPATVHVEDRRTGHRDEIQVSVSRPAAGRIIVSAAAVPPLQSVQLRELPERHRAVVQRGLARALVENLLSQEERDMLLSGTAGVRELAASALSRQIASLAGNPSETAVTRVYDLLDLLEQLGVTVSFEAQTAFYRILSGASGAVLSRLAPLASRLGFVDQ